MADTVDDTPASAAADARDDTPDTHVDMRRLQAMIRAGALQADAEVSFEVKSSRYVATIAADGALLYRRAASAPEDASGGDGDGATAGGGRDGGAGSADTAAAERGEVERFTSPTEWATAMAKRFNVKRSVRSRSRGKISANGWAECTVGGKALADIRAVMIREGKGEKEKGWKEEEDVGGEGDVANVEKRAGKDSGEGSNRVREKENENKEDRKEKPKNEKTLGTGVKGAFKSKYGATNSNRDDTEMVEKEVNMDDPEVDDGDESVGVSVGEKVKSKSKGKLSLRANAAGKKKPGTDSELKASRTAVESKGTSKSGAAAEKEDGSDRGDGDAEMADIGSGSSDVKMSAAKGDVKSKGDDTMERSDPERGDKDGREGSAIADADASDGDVAGGGDLKNGKVVGDGTGERVHAAHLRSQKENNTVKGDVGGSKESEGDVDSADGSGERGAIATAMARDEGKKNEDVASNAPSGSNKRPREPSVSHSGAAGSGSEPAAKRTRSDGGPTQWPSSPTSRPRRARSSRTVPRLSEEESGDSGEDKDDKVRRGLSSSRRLRATRRGNIASAGLDLPKEFKGIVDDPATVEAAAVAAAAEREEAVSRARRKTRLAAGKIKQVDYKASTAPTRGSELLGNVTDEHEGSEPDGATAAAAAPTRSSTRQQASSSGRPSRAGRSSRVRSTDKGDESASDADTGKNPAGDSAEVTRSGSRGSHASHGAPSDVEQGDDAISVAAGASGGKKSGANTPRSGTSRVGSDDDDDDDEKLGTGGEGDDEVVLTGAEGDVAPERKEVGTFGGDRDGEGVKNGGNGGDDGDGGDVGGDGDGGDGGDGGNGDDGDDGDGGEDVEDRKVGMDAEDVQGGGDDGGQVDGSAEPSSPSSRKDAGIDEDAKESKDGSGRGIAVGRVEVSQDGIGAEEVVGNDSNEGGAGGGESRASGRGSNSFTAAKAAPSKMMTRKRSSSPKDMLSDEDDDSFAAELREIKQSSEDDEDPRDEDGWSVRELSAVAAAVRASTSLDPAVIFNSASKLDPSLTSMGRTQNDVEKYLTNATSLIRELCPRSSISASSSESGIRVNDMLSFIAAEVWRLHTHVQRPLGSISMGIRKESRLKAAIDKSRRKFKRDLEENRAKLETGMQVRRQQMFEAGCIRLSAAECNRAVEREKAKRRRVEKEFDLYRRRDEDSKLRVELVKEVGAHLNGLGADATAGSVDDAPPGDPMDIDEKPLGALAVSAPGLVDTSGTGAVGDAVDKGGESGTSADMEDEGGEVERETAASAAALAAENAQEFRRLHTLIATYEADADTWQRACEMERNRTGLLKDSKVKLEMDMYVQRSHLSGGGIPGAVPPGLAAARFSRDAAAKKADASSRAAPGSRASGGASAKPKASQSGKGGAVAAVPGRKSEAKMDRGSGDAVSGPETTGKRGGEAARSGSRRKGTPFRSPFS